MLLENKLKIKPVRLLQQEILDTFKDNPLIYEAVQEAARAAMLVIEEAEYQPYLLPLQSSRTESEDFPPLVYLLLCHQS